ncbi:hypothetical protein CO615_10680 [Lysobacteraceae bacterium NML75-0749]|nr:hypothetical protein CO615_10680 [Xanthomonadaceae bacterium NML75-0749]
MSKLTREEAISMVGLEAVEAVERENCEPTNSVGYNGACQGDQKTEWVASVKATDADGNPVRIYAYYYTTNEQDAAMAAADGDGSVVDWVIDHYRVS